MIAYKLDNQIDGQKLLQDIDAMVSKFLASNSTRENALLLIQIKNISQENTNIIPKLTYENCTNDHSSS